MTQTGRDRSAIPAAYFWAQGWLHGAPEQTADTEGKRAVIQHFCFGPLETRIWYALRDGRYCCQHRMSEGIQAGDVFTDMVSPDEIEKLLEREIALCGKYGKSDMTALFQKEIEKTK